MAIEKFRFVSPGVQINEIDDSVLPPVAPAIGPVVIGSTAKGPFMQPVIVNTVAELEKIFGPASNGLVSGIDVWRSGTPTAPTFATYAAKAYLANASPITVMRLGGTSKLAGGTGEAGWSTDKAYHLFALSGSGGSAVAKLAAVIYTDSTYTLEINNSAGGFSSANSASYSTTFSLYFSSSSGRTEKKVSLDPSSTSFLRTSLNVNPSIYSTEHYFVGETFEKNLPNLADVSNIFLSSSNGWNTRTAALSSGETGWVIGDHAAGTEPKDLFKFKGINSGNSLSREIKISIENVRATKNEKVTKYGTFDVVVRRLFENTNSTPLERFNGVNLDPQSADYIARRIGDSVRRWDADNNKFVEDGQFSNLSSYIRVEVSDDITPTELPHGFRTLPRPVVGNAGFISTYTALHPDITMLSSARVASSKTTRFGFSTDEITTSDVVDILREKPSSVTLGSEVVFSTKFISGSSTSVTLSYASGTQNPWGVDVLTTGLIQGFNLPIYGGSDGIDILRPEPFIDNSNAALGANGATEYNNAKYRTVKQALDIVLDPETLDMNILCIPNLKTPALTQTMIDVCRTRGDAMAIIDLEGDHTFPLEGGTGTVGTKPVSVSSVISSLETRAIDDSYGAAYFPAVFVGAENIFMPASIAALGAFGGTEGRSALWFAPAGFNRGGLTQLNAGIGVTKTALTLTAADRDSLYAANINPIATFPNEGVVIFGQKTLQATPSALDRVNVRRLVNFIKKQISRAATRILFEPNVEATWNNFKGVVEPFLLNIKNEYGLDDARVVLDASTTTADLVDRNILYAKIFIKPTRAIEFIAIDFVITNSGAAFTE